MCVRSCSCIRESISPAQTLCEKHHHLSRSFYATCQVSEWTASNIPTSNAYKRATRSLVERQNQSTRARVKERGASGIKFADCDREGEFVSKREWDCERRRRRRVGGGERKGLALLKDREGQITNNKTERQGGRGGGKKRGKENMLSEGEGRREWKRESYVCQERCTSRCDCCSLRIFFFSLALVSFIYLPLFFSSA